MTWISTNSTTRTDVDFKTFKIIYVEIFIYFHDYK